MHTMEIHSAIEKNKITKISGKWIGMGTVY